MAQRYKNLLTIIDQVKPVTIMEIGTWDGKTASRMVRHARIFKRGKIRYFGFDLFMDAPDHEMSKPNPADMNRATSRLKSTGEKFTLFRGDTRETLPGNLPDLPQMDLIFIDGGHSVGTVKSDWKYSRRLMHPGTVVVFDDYWNEEAPRGGCREVIDALDRNRYEVELLEPIDTFQKPWGLLEVQMVKVTARQV